MSHLEQLGVVTTQTGVLIVIDTGYLNLWSHDQKPVMLDGVLSSEAATATANSFVDLHITGSEAERAGRMLGMSWHPLYVYDQPPEYRELQNKFDELVRAHKLDARLEREPDRIPHRQRVDQALQQGAGAGEVQFHGIRAVIVADVPTGRPLRVLGERSAAPDQDRWKQVSVECRPGAPVDRSGMVGLVVVDYARLLIADVDALGVWKHEESLDGLADCVFWGRDAEQVASAIAAPRLSANEFGWAEVSEDFAQERGLAVEEYRDTHSLKFACDYRPHSHHWRVMKPTRTSPTESGTIDLAGMTVCNFMTTWGDGLFEVHRDLGKAGELVKIRIELERGFA